MTSTTQNDANVKLMQRRMNAELKTLRDAINDPNALMASGEILGSLQRFETLRNEYADIAWTAHSAWCDRFIAERA